MTTTQDLIESSFELNLNNYGPEDVERLNDWAIKAHNALEALQAEHTDEVMRGLMLEKAHAMGLAERDAALARLAEIENQEPAYLLTPDGKCYAYGSAQPLSAGHADATLLKLYAAAGASSATEGKMGEALGIAEGCSGSMPTSQPWSKHPNPVHHVNAFPTEHLRDVVEHARVLHARVEAWVTDAQSGVFVTCPVSLSTGASPVEPSQAQPDPVNVGLMELLEPAFTEIQHVLGSTLEVPYQRKSLETALELVRAAIAVIKQSQPDYEAMHKKGFQAFDCPVCGFDGALGFQPAAQPSQAGELNDAKRLDWIRDQLFEHKWNGVVGKGCAVQWVVAPDFRFKQRELTDDSGIAAGDFRRAIDAAINAEGSAT